MSVLELVNGILQLIEKFGAIFNCSVSIYFRNIITKNFKFVGELKITILESASFTNNKSSSLLVFIGFKKFKISLTSSIEEGSLGNLFDLSLYSAWRKLVMSLGLRFSSLEANSSLFVITFAGLDEISSVAFRFTRFLTRFLSKRAVPCWVVVVQCSGQNSCRISIYSYFSLAFLSV